ncbi:GntR family transcriptional regulator [Streptomyces ferrugineus]|uniref:GntR family transcriptional regulator n=1 Tax=Streptomyces ferrugineus TaxID=1413221 RepID=A0A7M2SHT3_9ACTN|nr:GntR family transcriptional regulator [Streptomyces ferrugineus]QOV35003.1 GntR family transcriptional regulator [Streptomyces ferrugineus]
MSISSQSASEQAYAAIRDSILSGERAPGAMLGEVGLAAELGVSRTPVRAALVRLQDEGWITVYPKRGALVRGLSEKDARELADTRFVLESAAVQRATPQCRTELADRLASELDLQRSALGADDLSRFIELTLAFHRSFVEVGGNQVMLELSDRLADRQRFLLFALGDSLLARCQTIIDEHEALVARLRDEETEGFVEALRSHVTGTVDSGLRGLHR